MSTSNLTRGPCRPDVEYCACVELIWSSIPLFRLVRTFERFTSPNVVWIPQAISFFPPEKIQSEGTPSTGSRTTRSNAILQPPNSSTRIVDPNRQFRSLGETLAGSRHRTFMELDRSSTRVADSYPIEYFRIHILEKRAHPAVVPCRSGVTAAFDSTEPAIKSATTPDK